MRYGSVFPLYPREAAYRSPLFSGLSLATWKTLLSAIFGAILKALGLTVACLSEIEAPRLREEQARKKAAKLVGMVQGTSGLEAQAVDEAGVPADVGATVHELLAGSPRKLWAE